MVFSFEELTIFKEAGPKILIHSHSFMVPYGSSDADPSNEILSVGKVITKSDHAIATGGLLASFLSRLLFYRKNIDAMEMVMPRKRIFF